MPRGIPLDLTGQVFHRLTVLERAPRDPDVKDRSAQWWCRCSCGNYVKVRGRELTRDDGRNTKSCGCWRKERFEGVRTSETAVAARLAYAKSPEHFEQVQKMGQANYVHGHTVVNGRGTHSPTYITWKNMKDRCERPNDPSWAWYGQRGITVCKRWQKFANFLEDMGERPEPREDWSINRLDPDGHYTPENCEWATWDQQVESRRPWGSGSPRVLPLIES